MTRRLLLAGLAFCIVLGCGRPQYTNFPPKSGQTWVALGDSLTAGTGASPGHDYPSLLGQKLGVEILNAGVPGETTGNALVRIDDVLALNPKVVLLCLGGNDGLQELPTQDTVNNLSAIIARLQGQGAFVVLIGVRSASLMDKYEKPFRKLAQDKHTLFIPDIHAGVMGTRSLMSDQIHPNDAGYEKIATRLAKELRSAGADKL